MKKLTLGIGAVMVLALVVGTSIWAQEGAVKVDLYKGDVVEGNEVGWVIVNITAEDSVICELHMQDTEAAGETFDVWIRGFEIQNMWDLGAVTLNPQGIANWHYHTTVTDLTRETAEIRVVVGYKTPRDVIYRTALFPVPTHN